MKVIFHVDMDCFFASCHEASNTELHNLPVVVCYENRRGVALTANYVARKYHITAGTPSFKFKALCPQVKIIPPDSHLYNETANNIFNLIYQIIKQKKLVAITSIDECYIDVTDIYQKYGTAFNFAKFLQFTIYQRLKIPCSIGISFCKTFAKIASNNAKPYGIKIINDKNYQEIIYPMKIKAFSGIGKKSEIKLNTLGITTLGELRNYQDVKSLHKLIGRGIIAILNELQGKGNNEIYQTQVKSLGNEFTLSNDINNFMEIKENMWNLSQHLSFRLKKRYILCNIITIVLKYQDFSKKNYQIKINNYINDDIRIFQSAVKLIEENWNGKQIRLIGLRVSGFKNYSNVYHQQSLLNDEKIGDNDKIKINFDTNDKFDFINQVNHKYQKQVLLRGNNLSFHHNQKNEIIERDQKNIESIKK